MRQKLINKNSFIDLKHDSELLKSEHEKKYSLIEVLFKKNISNSDWKEGLKWHSQKLTNFLLNSDFESFDHYIQQEIQKSDFKDEKSDLFNLNYKSFLQKLLQLALLVEHSTIPPYLTALYSIKEGTNAWSSQIIRSIAVEEMLHMIMVCNVMNALDIQPSVNQPENYPVYPTKLPLNVNFYVNLEKFSTNSISTFISIESPSNTTVNKPNDDKKDLDSSLFEEAKFIEEASHWEVSKIEDFISKNINTIGEFYDLIFFFIVIFQILEFYKKNGKWPTTISQLNSGGIFKGDIKKQIHPDQYYGSGGILYSVENLEGVIKVFEEIKGQGEGGDGTIFSTDPSQFEEGFEPAHYFRFKEIFHEHTYVGGNYKPFLDKDGMMPITTPPKGKYLPVDWGSVYPITSNLKVSDLKTKPLLYEQAKLFNKTYKKLLDVIQDAVEGKQEALSQSVTIMYDLKNQAVDLMKQPLTNQQNAAPTFEYPIN